MEAVEIDVLKQIQSDLSFIKQKVSIIEEEVDAISGDIHELRPEYVKKLQEIEKKGKFLSFKNVDELRKSIESSEREDLFLFKMFRADSNGKKKFG